MRKLAALGCYFAAIAALLLVPCPQAHAQTDSGFVYRGIARAVFSIHDLGTPADDTFTQFIPTTGANYVELTVEGFVPSATATTIAPLSWHSATDDQIIAEIQRYHSLGLKVFLKPIVDTPTYTPWRAKLAPTSVSDWFTSYQAYVLHFAQLAQQYNVEGFVVGTELASLTVPENLPYWKTLIAAVRAAYTGTLTYSSNATHEGDEYAHLPFWDLLDLIGVDGYFPLTDQDDPSVKQLVEGWTNRPNHRTGASFNAVASLKRLHKKYKKPVVFMELGYESSTGTNQQPYAMIRNGYDPTEQANCYTAFFQVFSKESSWMQGVFWWDLNLPVPGPEDQSWSMYNKPAGTEVLPLWFGAAAPPKPADLPPAGKVSSP